MGKANEEINVDNEIYKKMLEALDEKELFNLCKRVSEKYLDANNELYQYFHSNDNNDRGVSI